MNKQYAIFDMDGTLIDSMPYWKYLGRDYLRSKGIHDNTDAVLAQIKTMTMTESAALFIKEFHLPGTPDSVACEMNDMLSEYYLHEIPLKEGVHSYLEALSKRGVRMCVASATNEALMKACLMRLDVLKYFDFLISCESIGSGKSEPDVYHAAAGRMGQNPSDIAVYEDALYAARTAKGAGYYVVGVYDSSEKENWKKMSELADEVLYADTRVKRL